MSNYNQSDYARNKDKESIVYKTAKGECIEITKESYLKENPDLTEEDFRKLKECSDEMYHTETKVDRDHRRALKKSKLFGSAVTGTHEDELIALEEKERIILFVDSLIANSKMTPTQKRRFMKYYGKGRTLRDIAQEEGVDHKAIHQSLRWANKKIKKIKNFL